MSLRAQRPQRLAIAVELDALCDGMPSGTAAVDGFGLFVSYLKNYTSSECWFHLFIAFVFLPSFVLLPFGPCLAVPERVSVVSFMTVFELAPHCGMVIATIVTNVQVGITLTYNIVWLSVSHIHYSSFLENCSHLQAQHILPLEPCAANGCPHSHLSPGLKSDGLIV